LRLKRDLETALANDGVELPIPPDGPVVRMVDRELVRAPFYFHTSADGTPEQKAEFRRKRFSRAVDWAESKQLVGVEEIAGTTYLRLVHLDPEIDDGAAPD
jgi:hypothetical protein